MDKSGQKNTADKNKKNVNNENFSPENKSVSKQSRKSNDKYASTPSRVFATMKKPV